MLENKLERIERRLKSDYDTVERLQRCCQEYMGYASDEEQRKNIVETDRTFYEMRFDSSEKLTFMLKKLIETFKKVVEELSVGTSVGTPVETSVETSVGTSVETSVGTSVGTSEDVAGKTSKDAEDGTSKKGKEDSQVNTSLEKDNSVPKFEVAEFKKLCDRNGDLQIISCMYDKNQAIIKADEGALKAYNEYYERQL